VSSEAKTLLAQLARLPLSDGLQRALAIARRADQSDFADWCQLELGGYFDSNRAMADTNIPVYRTVAGWHTDANDRPVELPSDDLNVIRLRNGIEELEGLPRRKKTVAIHDAYLCESIREQFQIEVFWYRFNTVQLNAIFSAIRVELWNKLAALDPLAVSEVPLNARNEILEPTSPEWFGGNPRAFWRRRSKGYQ
jgi:hypothetical protein